MRKVISALRARGAAIGDGGLVVVLAISMALAVIVLAVVLMVYL